MILAVKCRNRKLKSGCRNARACRWIPRKGLGIPGRRGRCVARRVVVKDFGFDEDFDEDFDDDFDDEQFDEDFGLDEE